VLHLHELHAALDSKLRALGRLDWLMADGERALALASGEGDDPMPHLALRSAQTLDAAGQARVRRLLRWRDAEARRSDRPKNWVLDNELAVQLSRRPFEDFQAFNALLDANPKSPRRARKDLFELLAQPLDEEERALPLNRAGEALDKQRLRGMQEAVAALAATLELPEGLLCARRHLEALLEGRGWPEALQGWRRSLLEPALAPLLP
jgi:ribonuclease D